MTTREKQKKLTTRKYFDFLRDLKRQCTQDNTFSPHNFAKEMQVNRNIIRVLKDLGYLRHNTKGRLRGWQWFGPRITLQVSEDVRSALAKFVTDEKKKKQKEKTKPKEKPKSKIKTNPVKKINATPENKKLISESDPRFIRLEDIYHELESIKKFLRMIYLKNR